MEIKKTYRNALLSLWYHGKGCIALPGKRNARGTVAPRTAKRLIAIGLLKPSSDGRGYALTDEGYDVCRMLKAQIAG